MKVSIQEIYESEFEKEKPGFLQGETGIERAAAGRGHSRLGGAGSGGAGGAVAEEHPVHPAGPDAAEDPAYPAAVVAHRPGGEEAQLPGVGAGIPNRETADKSRSDAISRNGTTSKAFHKIKKFLDPLEAL